MRILFVTDHAGTPGGAEKSLITLIRKLIRRGHEVYCILPQHGETYNMLASYGVKIKIMPMPVITRKYNPFKIAYWLLSLIFFGVVAGIWCRLKEIDIIHVNKTPCVFYGVITSAVAWLPVIWHVRNFNRRFGIIGRIIYRHVDAVVCISHAIAKPFFEYFADSRDKIQVVYNGVYIDPLKKISVRSENILKELAIAKPVFIVGVVGRITAWKKIEVFLHAMHRIMQQNSGKAIYGVVIGDCVTSKEQQMQDDIAYKNYLMTVHEKLQLQDKVRFINFKEDIETYIGELDMLVLPSENEPFGRVIIEAMALGVPVIAANSGAVPEIVIHNETGVLFPLGNDKSLAEEILRLYHDPLLLRRIAKDGWKRTHDYFSADICADNMEKLYESILV